jgi:hypothetical protein
MTSGEKILSRPPKKYAWPPVLRNAAILRLHWKLRLREHTHNLDDKETFRRWQQRVQTQDSSFKFSHLDDPLSLSQVREHFNRATAACRSCQKAPTRPLRVKSYYELLEKYSEDRNPDTISESRRKAKIVQTTIDGEIVKPIQTRALSKILVPRLGESLVPSEETYRAIHDSDPQSIFWETVVERDNMERHLLHYNRESFRAAAESPCGNAILFDATTFSSLSPASSDLLAGEFPSEWHGDMLRGRYPLRHFRRQHSQRLQLVDGVNVNLSFRPAPWPLQVYNSRADTAPMHGRIHEYCDAERHFHPSMEQRNYSSHRERSRPATAQQAPNHTSIRSRSESVPQITMGKTAHPSSDRNNLLHDGQQHGSVPGRNTFNPIMLMQLTTDLCRILKHDFARFDNDASACYNRIIIALGMLAARKCRMPAHAIRTHSDALEFMRYKVKTIFGISSENCHGTPFEPFFGSGQGSGASSAVWLTLVVILLQALDHLIPDRLFFTSIQGDLEHS